MSTVLGVDGAAGGWVIAEYNVANHTLSLSFDESLANSFDRVGSDVATIAIDMPIGLSADGERSADLAARTRLEHRRSTFFPTPIRDVLECASFDEANALSKATSGKGLSVQAWNLVPKIRELDSIWLPGHADTVFEAHPELSFAELAGNPLDSKKATPEGRSDRMSLLSGVVAGAEIALATLPNKWCIDGVDAMVLAWTAARVLAGTATVLGGELDVQGRPMRLAI